MMVQITDITTSERVRVFFLLLANVQFTVCERIIVATFGRWWYLVTMPDLVPRELHVPIDCYLMRSSFHSALLIHSSNKYIPFYPSG